VSNQRTDITCIVLHTRSATAGLAGAGHVRNETTRTGDEQKNRLTDGTGAHQAQKRYLQDHTVPSAGLELDLQALTDPIEGTTSFSNVRGFHLEALHETTDKAGITGGASNPFTAPWGASGEPQTDGGGQLLFDAARGGWTVDGTSKTVKLTNSGGSAITVRLHIWGH